MLMCGGDVRVCSATKPAIETTALPLISQPLQCLASHVWALAQQKHHIYKHDITMPEHIATSEHAITNLALTRDGPRTW